MELATIIGAGPAGLAVAYELSRRGLSYRLLDESDQLASSWRRRHPQLRLNTVRTFSHQPGWRIPRHYGRWVSRDDYIHYLEDYARRFSLKIELSTRVEGLARIPGGWELRTTRAPIQTRNVVVCTGVNRAQRMPIIAGLESFDGIVRHSEDFGDAQQYHGRRVLIIGGGNSGFDVASHLARTPVKELVMSIRTPPSVAPKEIFGVPTHALAVLGRSLPQSLQDFNLRLTARLSLGDLSLIGIGRAPVGAYTRVANDGVTVAVDDGFLAAVRQGHARIVPEIVKVENIRALARDGQEVQPEVIICATGFTPGLERLIGHLGVLDRFGYPTTIGAQSNPAHPGLWFLGLRGYIWGNMHEQRGQSRSLARAIARRSHDAFVMRRVG